MYQRIVILTGAGISAESGLQTFRAADGLWEQHNIEDVATPEGYQRDPQLVERFYNSRLSQFGADTIKPNLAHQALAKLTQEFDGQVLLVTQNIDDLHEQAGSTWVHHMHGELHKGRCPITQQTFAMTQPFGEHSVCTCCMPAQKLRPHVVWFGEIPIGMPTIHQALSQCDLFIAIGTSGTVYPAAGFVDEANFAGAQTLSINIDAVSANSLFQYHLKGKASEMVPLVVDKILAHQRVGE